MSNDMSEDDFQIDPKDWPDDPDERLCFVIGFMIRHKANKLVLGDREQLVELACWIARAVEGGGIAELPHIFGEEALRTCPSCATCAANLKICTKTPAQCTADYNNCVSCPCT